MRKAIITLGMLVMSASSFATTSNLPHAVGSAITNLVQTEAHATVAPSSITYAGRDISRRVVASADESFWSGQHTLVG